MKKYCSKCGASLTLDETSRKTLGFDVNTGERKMIEQWCCPAYKKSQTFIQENLWTAGQAHDYIWVRCK